MKKLAKIFCIFLLLGSLNACAFYSRPLYDAPYTYDENAPDIWKLGWQHGCKSGFAAYGNSYYKTLYNFEQDIEKVKNPTYFKAWMDSLNYCRSIINRSLAGSSITGAPKRSGIFANKGFNITSGNKRDDQAIFKTGLFEGTSDEGFFGSMFNFNLPGWSPDKEAGCGFLVPCTPSEEGGVGWF